MKSFMTFALVIFSVSAHAKILEKLPADDALARVAKAVGTQLADGNISSGTTTLSAGKLIEIKKADFQSYLEAGFVTAYKKSFDNQTPESARTTIVIGNFIEGDTGTVDHMVD